MTRELAARLGKLAVAALLAVLAVLAGACAKGDRELLAELEDRDPHVRAFAAFALAVEAPEHASRALPELLETVDRVELELGPQATAALALLAPRVAGELVAQYTGETILTAERRRAIETALGRAGPAGVAPILAGVRGPGRERAAELAGALAGIGAPSVEPLAAIVAGDPDPWLRGWAAWTLGSLGPRAQPAVATLRAALADPHPSVARLAKAALARIAEESGEMPRARELEKGEVPRGR